MLTIYIFFAVLFGAFYNCFLVLQLLAAEKQIQNQQFALASFIKETVEKITEIEQINQKSKISIAEALRRIDDELHILHRSNREISDRIERIKKN